MDKNGHIYRTCGICTRAYRRIARLAGSSVVTVVVVVPGVVWCARVVPLAREPVRVVFSRRFFIYSSEDRRGRSLNRPRSYVTNTGRRAGRSVDSGDIFQRPERGKFSTGFSVSRFERRRRKIRSACGIPSGVLYRPNELLGFSVLGLRRLVYEHVRFSITLVIGCSVNVRNK